MTIAITPKPSTPKAPPANGAAAPVQTSTPAAPATPAVLEAEGAATVEQLRASALEVLTKGVEEDEAAEEAEGEEPETPAADVEPAKAKPKVKKKPDATAAPGDVEPIEETPAEPKDDPLAALNARFEELVKEKAELRREKEALAKDREGDPLAKARKAKDALSALKALGYSIDDVVEQVISGKKGEPAKKPKAEIDEDDPVHAELKALREEFKEVKEERAAVRKAQGRAADAATIGKALEAAGEKYELLRSVGQVAVDQVYAESVGKFLETGEWPGGSPKAALDFAMATVQKRLEPVFDGVLKSEWAKRKMSSAVTQPKAVRPNAPVGPRPSAAPRTLSNSQAAASPPRPASTTKSVAELRQEAIKVLEEAAADET